MGWTVHRVGGRRGLCRLLAVALVALVALVTACAPYPRDVYVGKGLFGEIIVQDDARGLRSLSFDRVSSAQSTIKPRDPAHLEFEYLRVALIGLTLARHPPQRILIVGLGGGSIPLFLRLAYPDARIDVAEIDPAVLQVAERYFGLRQDARLRVHVGDGRAFIERAAPASYDLIILDAYGHNTVPPHLTTLEFLRAVRAALRPDGVAVSNIWGPNLNPRYHDMLSTQRAAFDALQIVYTPNEGNVLVFALPRVDAITRDQLAARARRLGPPELFRYDLGAMVEAAWLDADVVAVRGQVLCDAPDGIPYCEKWH